MKCLVCAAHFSEQAHHCPHCGEFVIQIMGDYEKGQRLRLERAQKRREKLLGAFQAGVCARKLQQGSLTAICVPVAPAPELFLRERWCPEPFARAAASGTMTFCLSLLRDGTERQIPLDVPVPASSGLLQLGAIIREGFQLSLLVRSGDGETTASSPIALMEL